MTPTDMVTALAQLSTTGTLAAMADRDIVIEAVVENEAVKVQLYKQLQAVLPPDAILASNTSTISITRMAGSVARLSDEEPVPRLKVVVLEEVG